MTAGNTSIFPPYPRYEPYVEVSLDNLVHNLNQVRTRLPEKTGIIAVVKDSAYGCGAIPVARALQQHDVSIFAVVRPAEARSLREASIHSPILILGDASAEDLAWGAGAAVHFSLGDLGTLERWGRYGHPVSFHCEIDTGMGRLGLQPGEIPAFIELLKKFPALLCTGLFTHFACADDPDPSSVNMQIGLFSQIRADLHRNGIEPPIVHCANSAGILRHKLKGFTHVRPGIALYGCRPDPLQLFDIRLEPVLTLASRVVKVKKIAAGTPISYGWNYTAPRDTVIATIAGGYACGIPRLLGAKGSVLVGEKHLPFAGNVTMDFIMVDAGPDSLVTVGDEAVFIGKQGSAEITPDDIARMSNTIGYEVLCGLGTGMHRYYSLNGNPFMHQPPCLY